MSKDLVKLSVSDAADGMASGEFSSEELVRAHLEKISQVDGDVKSYLRVTDEAALTAARSVDERRLRGEELGGLAGIPMSVKDVMTTRGVETTASARILSGYVPSYTATSVARLEEAGAISLGKVNCDAFAHGSSTENSDFGPSHNPWDLSRVPGGSSGGSAASVAAGEAMFSIGTDTGGSIRQPAAFCGIVGVKPTYGRVSRRGLIAMGSSLDCVGPFARTVADAAAVLEAIAGQDDGDATTSPKSVGSYVRATESPDVRGLKIGIPREYFDGDGLDSGVKERFDAAVKELVKLGAELVDVSLPHTKYAIAVYYILCSSEVSSNLSRFDGIRYGHSAVRDGDVKDLLEVYEKSRSEAFGEEAKRRIMIGTHTLSSGYYDAYYKRAAQVRTLIKRDFEKAFEEVDVLAAPVTPHVAFALGAKSSDPLEMYLEDIYVSPASLAGVCAMSLPSGLVDGMPTGLQLIGNYFDEERLFEVGAAYEAVRVVNEAEEERFSPVMRGV